MSIHEFEIHNLNCASCAGKIEEEIRALPEVSEAILDFMNKKIVVQYHEKVDDPLRRLNQIADSIEPGVVFATPGLEETSTKVWHWLPLGAGTLLLVAGQFLASPWSVIFGVLGYLLVGHRVLLAAGKAILSRKVFSEQFLMSIATLGAIALGEFLEAGAVMLLYELGQALEHRALEHSRRSVKGVLAVRAETAHVRSDAGTVEKRLAEVAPGEVILVYPGERVPLDGLILKGESTVDTSTLTGESEPQPVEPGLEICAGFLNQHGLLEIEVSSIAAESTVSRILKLIENAGARKSSREKFITRFAAVYTPLVVLAALLVFLVPVLLGYPAAIWLKRALVLLIVSCPCALVISIPLTYFIAIGLAAKRGIIIKGSVFLDTLRKVETIVFDKTGTLTTGRMRLEQAITPAGRSADELLETLYRCEFTSSHPFARAVREGFAGSYDSKLVNAYSEYPGKGVLLLYGEDRLIAGSETFLREHGFVELLQPETHSVVHAVSNDIYLGCATFSDELKPGIGEALAGLRKQILRMAMLSGDRRVKAEAVSRELGLDEYFPELLPEQKLETLERIMAEQSGATAFVGDGMNDGPALARADVGIAMGGIGIQSSIETADVVLLNDKPQQLAGAFALARLTSATVAQNIALALGIKIAVMALGVGGISGLWEAIIADVGVTLLVIFNSLRMMRFQRGA